MPPFKIWGKQNQKKKTERLRSGSSGSSGSSRPSGSSGSSGSSTGSSGSSRSSGSSGSSGSRRGPRGPAKPLTAALLASRSLAAPSSQKAGDDKIHSSLLLLLHYLRSLYGMDLVPDTSEFNRLMMMVIAEVADNTSHVGMRDYPSQLAASLGAAAKAAQPSGARFAKSSVQHKILNSGLVALERCATKYLETGGGRFESAQSVAQRAVPKRRPSKKRARGPGKALTVLLNDFKLYDNQQRADIRHLPSASASHCRKTTKIRVMPAACCGSTTGSRAQCRPRRRR